MIRFAPRLAILVLIGPILCGLLATLFPAFGYFPALGGEQLTLEPFKMLFAQPGIWRSSLVSLLTGLLTTAISLFLVLAFFASWAGTPLFQKVQGLISPLLSIPHAAAAFGLAFMISPSGWLMRLLSPELTGFIRPPDWHILNDPMGLSMIAGLVIKEIPFLFLVTLAAMPQVRAGDNRRIAASLGYGRVAGFFFVLWPQLYRQIRLAVFAVIAYASSVVDVALILGPTNPAPLAVRLIDWMNDPDLAMRFPASAGALLQLGVTAAALIIWIIGECFFTRVFRAQAGQGHRYARDKVFRYVSSIAILIVAVMFVTGLIILALWSVAGYWAFPDALPSSFNLRTWQNQLQGFQTPFYNTIVIGLLSTVIAIGIALACLEREARTGRSGGDRALLLLYLPLIVPQAGFVFGLQMFFLVLGLNASFAALLLVHLVFVLPYVFLSLSDPWRAFDRRYDWTAATMGISRNRAFWQIRFPMLARAILVACAIGFAVSIGQYLPTILIGAGRWPTLTTEAVALASGGDRRVIGVYAFLQMLLPFAGFLLAALVPAIWFANRRDMQAGK
jgi:putative thiamine transport system permease protein